MYLAFCWFSSFVGWSNASPEIFETKNCRMYQRFASFSIASVVPEILPENELACFWRMSRVFVALVILWGCFAIFFSCARNFCPKMICGQILSNVFTFFTFLKLLIDFLGNLVFFLFSAPFCRNIYRVNRRAVHPPIPPLAPPEIKVDHKMRCWPPKEWLKVKVQSPPEIKVDNKIGCWPPEEWLKAKVQATPLRSFPHRAH